MHDLRRLGLKVIKYFREDAFTIHHQKIAELMTAQKLDQSFPMADPDEWEVRADFNSAKQIVAAVCVVNDCTEHSVKLAMNYSTALTQVEDQHQPRFQVVKYY